MARRYVLTMIISIVVVDLFACIQYQLIQGDPFNLFDYLVPTLWVASLVT